MTDPYPFYSVMRSDHPLFFNEGLRAWVISRYEDVSRSFKEPVFSTRNYEWQYVQWFGPLINHMEGAQHAAYRSLLAPALRGRQLFDTFLPMIKEKASRLFDAFVNRGEADLVDEFTTRFPINVIVGMLGLAESEHERFHRWHTAIAAFFGNFAQDPAVHADGLKTRDELYEFLLPLMQERRRRPSNDLLSTLCTAEILGVPMTDHEVQAFCSMLFGAGGDTTDRSLASLFKNLLDHPRQLEDLRKDRDLVPRAIAESLRTSPPLHVLLRMTDAEVSVSGGVIPANAVVAVFMAAANRDPSRFKDADTFDIHRPDLDIERAFAPGANHVSFGGGRHFCLGSLLGKVEIEIGLNLLLDRLDDLQFADGQSPAEVGFPFRAPRTLPVRFTPRRN